MNPKDTRSLPRRILTRVVELLSQMPGADRIVVRRYQVRSQKIPCAFDGFTLVQISDLHSRWFGENQEKLLAKIRQIQPDLIVCSGDWIDLDYIKEEKECVNTLVKGMLSIAPVYGILGNHEARAMHKSAFIHEMRELGVTMLLNETVYFMKDGESIALTGFVTSYHTPLRENKTNYDAICSAYAKALEPEELYQKASYKMALGHRPELIDLYQKLGLDLVMAGHAHGGLMKLPGERRLLAPGQGWFPKFTHGAYRKGHMALIVSSGLGGPRIGILPEISLVRLTRPDTSIQDGGKTQ